MSSESVEVGEVEGDKCNRNGCQGTIIDPPVENCSCHINPPCWACTEPREYCDTCDWQAEDEVRDIPEYARKAPADLWKPRTLADLDSSKVDWIHRTHTHASMVKEGVYPMSMSQDQVRKEVNGTFGGRFVQFGGGRFKFIAYTD